jgi:hypothetical protein
MVTSNGWDGRAEQTNQVFGLITEFILAAAIP